jgi:autotransporter-associated beta strand protein
MLDQYVAATKRNRRLVGLGAIFAATAGVFLTSGNAHAQSNLIFSDNFSNGSTENNGPNNNTATPILTNTATNYDIASTKNASTSIAAGSLSISLASTSSGVVESQALFTNSPVQLQNTGDAVDLNVVFTDTAALLAAGNSSELYFGLYNSSQVQPLSGLLSSGLSTSQTADTNGGAANWAGYNAEVAPATGTGRGYLRPPQSLGANNSDQDLLGNGAGGGLYNSPTGPTLGSGTSNVTLTVGQQYTSDLLVTYAGNGTESLQENLYQGVGDSGTNLFSLTAAITGANVVTNTFDSMAIGYRESATSGVNEAPTNMTVNQITVSKITAPVFVGWVGTDATDPNSWAIADNWSNNIVPNAVGATANFASSNTTSVTLDGNETVGTVLLANTTAYTLASGSTNTTSTLIMDNGGTAATALISATLGAGHVIQSPIILNSNVVLNSIGGTSLTISGNISSGTFGATGVTISGGGFVSLQSSSNTYTGGTTIDAGATLKVQGVAAVPTGTNVINNGALSIQTGNILGSPVQGPVVLGAISGTGTLAVGSNKNAYLQLTGPLQQNDLTMMLTNGTSGVEAALDLNGQNATIGGLATGTAGLNVIGNSSLLSGSTLTLAPASATATYTFSGTLTDGINGVGSQLAVNVNSGSLILTGSNSYSGNTTIGSGAYLQVSTTPTALAPTTNVVNNGELDVEISSNAGSIKGTGNLVIGATTPSVLKLGTSTGASTVGSLTVNSGSSLDVNNNALYINYGTGADPIATIASYLTDGFNSGWTTGEIISSAVSTDDSTQSKLSYSIGYADGADGAAVTTLPSGTIEILPTLAGDAKLQGNVVFGDFQILAQYFGQAGSWDEGNFKYGATVNFGDFQLLAQDFGSTSGGLAGAELASMNSFAAQFGDELVANPGGGFSVVSVPEPASLSILSLAGVTLLRRSRRKTS